jgi:hypothetical protein
MIPRIGALPSDDGHADTLGTPDGATPPRDGSMSQPWSQSRAADAVSCVVTGSRCLEVGCECAYCQSGCLATLWLHMSVLSASYANSALATRGVRLRRSTSTHRPLASLQRSHELHGGGADLGSLGGQRQRADVVGISLRNLKERQAAVLTVPRRDTVPNRSEGSRLSAHVGPDRTAAPGPRRRHAARACTRSQRTDSWAKPIRKEELATP